jgi:hypothetical protein
MAVVSIATVGGQPSRDGAWTAEQKRTYKETKRVRTNDPLDNQVTVLQAVSNSIPLYGAYPGDVSAQLRSITVRDTEWPMCWEAEVEWSSETLEQANQPSPPPGGSGPPGKPRTIAWSTETVTEIIDKDFNGNWISNSADEAFETPAEREHIRLIINITKNLATINVPDIANNYLRRTNSSSWSGFAPGEVFFREFSATQQHEQGVSYWATTWVFVQDYRGWRLSLLDAGPNYRDLNDPTILRAFTDPDSRQRQNVGLLNGIDGEPLPTGGTPVFLDFTMYGTADFNLLPIN